MTSLPPSAPEPSETPHTVVPRNLALGIERIGFFSLTHRVLCAIALVAMCFAAAIGYSRLKVDDSLSQLFRSDTPDYRTYTEVTRRFPSNEFDVLIVIEGDTVLQRASLQHLRDLAIDLQLLDGTRGLISMFSAREPPNGGHIPPPLFPTPLPQGAEFQALVQKVQANEIIKDKLLSNDGKLTLMVLALDPAVMAPGQLDGVIASVRKTVNQAVAGTGMRADLSGVPVMQLEIRQAIERDRLTYNSLGFVIGCLIAVIFFRRVSFMVIAAGPPLAAILLALGALGWFGFQLNIFLNVMTPLIMVISFSDSMQLTFAARDRLIAGDSKAQAFRNALYIVGTGLRADPRDRRRVVHRAAVLLIGPDPHLRRGRPHRHRDRAVRGAARRAAARRAADPQRGKLRRKGARRRPRARRAAALLQLDRAAHGGAARALLTHQPDRGDRAVVRLRPAFAALPARRPGAGPRAGGAGEPPPRHQAHRRQPVRRLYPVPRRRLALRSRDARRDRRRAPPARAGERRRQRLVAGNLARVARREGPRIPRSRRCGPTSTCCRTT